MAGVQPALVEFAKKSGLEAGAPGKKRRLARVA